MQLTAAPGMARPLGGTFRVAKLSNSRSIIPAPARELVGSLAKSNTDNEKRYVEAVANRRARRIVAIFRPFWETLRTIVWLQNGQPSGVEGVTTDERPAGNHGKEM